MFSDMVRSLRMGQKLKTPSEIFPPLTADHSSSKNMSLLWSEDGIKIERYYIQCNLDLVTLKEGFSI